MQMKRSLITLVLLSGAVFAAEPQKGAAPAAAQGGPGEQRQRPDPTQMAAKMMSGFDANKDGILSQAELTLALDDMHKNRPQRPAQNNQPSGTNQVVKTEQRPEPPASDKMAAQMIEKFAADKKGLTAAELTKALAERRGQGEPRGERPARPEQNAQ
jgi:hypothetical protein